MKHPTITDSEVYTSRDTNLHKHSERGKKKWMALSTFKMTAHKFLPHTYKRSDEEY